jgi:hypothetical protein
MVVVPDDFVQVCLVNTGTGTPFISSLDLRPLHRTHYPQVTAVQGLALTTRLNFGPTDDTLIVRYPDDPHDRIWYPMVDTTRWTEISTTQKVQSRDNDFFEAPSAVLQTAIRPQNASHNLEFTWSSEPTPMDPSPGYIVILHFAELQILPGNAVRQLNVVLNGKPWYTTGFTTEYLYDAVSPTTLNPSNTASVTTSTSRPALTQRYRRSSTLWRSSPSSPPQTSAATPRTVCIKTSAGFANSQSTVKS